MTYKSNKPAFTLVELLVTITIIAILASMSLVALSSSRGQAKIFRTRSTIMKIDTAIGEIYERYEYDERKVKEADLTTNAKNYINTAPNQTQKNLRTNQMLLMAMRDLIRKEMPMNWIEVLDANPNLNENIGNVYGSEVPVSRYYKLAHDSGSDDNASAELLYLIIANLNPEALSNFATGEIGDTDNDGLPEFIDGWGNPIRFLRWAPGLYDSEIQPVVYNLDGTLKSIDEIRELREKNADPLDTTNTGTNKMVAKQFALNDIKEITGTQTSVVGDGFARGWFLYPLIVSGGPDGDHGLYGLEDVTQSSFECANPFIIKDVDVKTSKPLLFGAPLPVRPNAYKDNIHNHQR